MMPQQHIKIFLTCCFIPAAIYLLVSMGYKMITAPMETMLPHGASSRPKNSVRFDAPKPLPGYSSIESRNLFKTPDTGGKVQPPPEVPKEAMKELTPTTLKLKLWGTVFGDSERSYAVIEDPQKRMQNLYREGDAVQPNALVKRILREQVVLTVNGKDERLSMEKGDTGGPQVAKAATEAAPPAPTPFEASGSPPEEGGSRRIELKRKQIEDAINNVNELMRQAKIRPHFQDGKPNGLTLSRIQPDSIFEKLGLKSGDVITGVDGQDIQSVDDALRFYNSLKTSPSVKLQIRRQGQSQTIDYSID